MFLIFKGTAVSRCSQEEIEEHTITTEDKYGDNYRHLEVEPIFRNKPTLQSCYELCMQKFWCMAFLYDNQSQVCQYLYSTVVYSPLFIFEFQECRLLDGRCVGPKGMEKAMTGSHIYYELFHCPAFVKRALSKLN